MIRTERLILTPLRPDDADEMSIVLGDELLHEFIGGRPLGVGELRERYMRLAAGSPRPGEVWLNWTARRRTDSTAVGTVQATIVTDGDRRTALIAWVIGSAWANQGFASEAAAALVDWLRGQGVHEIDAHIHPHHRASATVATRAGLQPTEGRAGDEIVWRVRS